VVPVSFPRRESETHVRRSVLAGNFVAIKLPRSRSSETGDLRLFIGARRIVSIDGGIEVCHTVVELV